MSLSEAEIRKQFVRYLHPSEQSDVTVPAYEISDVEGEIPRELHGTLYRIGPSQRQLPPEGAEAMHLFDGDGLVHALRFDDGRARYEASYVQTESFLAEQEQGRFCMSGLQIDARDPIEMQRDEPNTNVVPHGGRLFAMVENRQPFELDPKSLAPLGVYDYQGKMLGLSTTAHPKIDGRTGQMWIHGYQPVEPWLTLYCVEPDGEVSLAEAIESPWPTMMHDFAITENHVVFPQCPIHFDISTVDLEKGGLFKQAIKWEPERGLKFGVRSRLPGSEVQWFDAPTPGYMFHPGNAYEEDGIIWMDACVYYDGKAFLRDLSSIRSGEFGDGLSPVPVLYAFDLETGECRERQLSDRSAEFPRIDDRLVGYRNRWGYCATSRPDAISSADGAFSALLKYDRSGGASEQHDLPEAHWVGEPVFVPLSEGAAEDEGVVLSVVYDGPRDRSSVYVLDARNFGGPPIAKLHLRERVPLGFHGNFAPGIV